MSRIVSWCCALADARGHCVRDLGGGGGVAVFFFVNDTATTEIYTLSLHDALPILQTRLNKRKVGGHFSIFGDKHGKLDISIQTVRPGTFDSVRRNSIGRAFWDILLDNFQP